MQQKKYKVIGLMSGTSLDGIDLVYVNISPGPSFSAQILEATTISYSKSWKHALANAHTLSKESLNGLNDKYTNLLGTVILDFVRSHKLSHIDAICSHGHTVLHQPQNGFTRQIGNLPQLAIAIGHKVVCDFRVQDVALGGQGAPLVPIGDRMLFGEYDYCLNLGGFANVSHEQNGRRIAYDICAVNTVLNRYAEQLGKGYDDEGAFAKAGIPNPNLLEKLNGLPFFKKLPPKSLGIEWVHEIVLPLIEEAKLKPEDVLATFTHHIAIQLRKQFKDNSSVLITGGGAFNNYLIELLKENTTVDYVLPGAQLIEYKEALIFAILGVLKLEGAVNTLASVTGAKHDHSAGEIHLP